jgi:hypothetical protein
MFTYRVHLMLSRFALVLLAFVSVAAAPAGQTLQVAPLPRGGEVLVSFKLGEAYNDDIKTAIHSGLTVSFIYRVDLKRSSAAWFDRTIASAEVKATVRYDNLTRRYHLSRTLDGRMDDATTTDREETAWSWLTSEFEKLSLFRSTELERNAEYYVRVRMHSTPRNATFIWPWQGHDVVGLANFTVIR